MGVKCSKCHFENPSDSEFCNKCRAKLVPSEEIPIQTKTIQTPAREAIKDVDVGEIIDEKYKLIKELGSGGMGVVYKAEQKEPIKRNVALKVIKLGMDTEEVVARFETEKQALAVMKHPNIARDTLKSLHNLAVVFYYQSKFDRAEAIARELLEKRMRILGPDHNATINALELLAAALHGQKRHEAAEHVYHEAKEKAERVLGSEHPDTLRIKYNLAFELNELRKYKESEDLLLDTLEKQKRVFGSEHPLTKETMELLDKALKKQGKND